MFSDPGVVLIRTVHEFKGEGSFFGLTGQHVLINKSKSSCKDMKLPGAYLNPCLVVTKPAQT